MNESLWQTLCDRYGLGTARGLPHPVSGGLQHRLYRAQADSGPYAVKVLSAQLLREPGRRRRCELGERIAQAAAQAGLPVVSAFPGPTGVIQSVGEASCLVFPWHAGTALPPGAADAEAARKMGLLLGRLHALAVSVPGLTPPPLSEHPDAEWTRLVTAARREQVVWEEQAADALPDLFRWSRAAQAARDALGPHTVPTHRDMDQKNVLWSDPQTPWLLDWEDAGLMNPVLEVMGTALNWAGQAAGPPAEAPFAAFLADYRQVMPLPTHLLQHAAVAVLDKWLVWLKFNMRRSLAETGAAPDEQSMAWGAATHALMTLAALDKDTSRRLHWCEER